jgi:transposase
VQYVGIDWAYRRAAWCAMREGGDIEDEGLLPADEDGLAKLVLRLGSDVRACVEMMSGAVWVRDRLQAAGWGVEVADARKVKGLAPLACKTDKVDARVLAELCRRNLVPTVWLPSLDTAPCASASSGACTWSECGPWRATASTACLASGV